jgi:hypothetical protein
MVEQQEPWESLEVQKEAGPKAMGQVHVWVEKTTQTSTGSHTVFQDA